MEVQASVRLFLQRVNVATYLRYISKGIHAGTVVMVIKVLRWQKNKTLDVPLIGASEQVDAESNDELPAEE